MGLAWYEFLTADPAAAQDRLEQAAHGWLAEQSVGLALLAAFALFRLRFDDCAAALLDKIDVPADWPFGTTVAALIRARGPADYLTAGDAFRAYDMRLYAAEGVPPGGHPHAPARPETLPCPAPGRDARPAVRRRHAVTGRLSPATALTRREEQIAALAAGGASNREVAQHLGLSERTVENHLHRVFTSRSGSPAARRSART